MFTVVITSLPMLFALAFNIGNNSGLKWIDYVLLTEFMAIPLIIFISMEIYIHNIVWKVVISTSVCFLGALFLISSSIKTLEFLGLRNNPNVISLLNIEMKQSDLTGRLRDMGFHQLQYNGNESKASDSQLERYVFDRGIESAIYLTSIAESQAIHLAELESYVINNKNTICNSKLNRAVLSEFENGDALKHYFGYEGCNANINSFQINDKIKLDFGSFI